jgi:hypothetical protein
MAKQFAGVYKALRYQPISCSQISSHSFDDILHQTLYQLSLGYIRLINSPFILLVCIFPTPWLWPPSLPLRRPPHPLRVSPQFSTTCSSQPGGHSAHAPLSGIKSRVILPACSSPLDSAMTMQEQLSVLASTTASLMEAVMDPSLFQRSSLVRRIRP